MWATTGSSSAARHSLPRATGGKDADADESDVACIITLDQKRHERDQQQLGQSRPGQHVSDLLGSAFMNIWLSPDPAGDQFWVPNIIRAIGQALALTPITL